jgi:hypothetical protein
MNRLQITFAPKDFTAGSEWLEKTSTKLGFSYDEYQDIYDTEDMLYTIEKELELSGLNYTLYN